MSRKLHELETSNLVCCLMRATLSLTNPITAELLRCVYGYSFTLVAYQKSIGTKMNDFDLCLEVV